MAVDGQDIEVLDLVVSCPHTLRSVHFLIEPLLALLLLFIVNHTKCRMLCDVV